MQQELRMIVLCLLRLKFKVMKRLIGLVVLAAMYGTTGARAQESVELSAGADLVSTYVWRGTRLASASIQPSLGVAYKGVSLGAWGSVDFDGQYKELDLSLAYEIKGFSLMLTDYYTAAGENYFGNYKRGHLLEATAAYCFGDKVPLTLAWSTMFVGELDKKVDDRHAYSSYFEASYELPVRSFDLTFAVGVAPWSAPAWLPGKSGFQVANVSVKAARDIKITDSYSFPLFVQLVACPAQEDMNIVFGMSF